MESNEFANMKLKEELLYMIKAKGFTQPTPIQQQTIPLTLQGRDIMGQAQTGTGKTAAFGLPILNNIDGGKGLQALIMCPTRELAMQVSEEISFLGRRLHMSVLPIYGGQSIEVQFKGLQRNPEIVVATPGRMLDHLNRRTIDLSRLNFVVLDEADEMLDMGFLPDIERILEQCPPQRQTLLFSATLAAEIRELGGRFMNAPELVVIEPEQCMVAEIDHCYYDANPRRKVETLCRIIDMKQPATSLIFCRTKKSADQLAHVLDSRGYGAEALHGDMSQRERDNVMNRYRRGAVRILAATDLAARGLDVELVTHVFNYDLPEDPAVYIHRTGRTGRAGRSGEALSLLEPSQRRLLRMIEKHIGKKIRREQLPTLADAIEGRKGILIDSLTKGMENTNAHYADIAAELLDKHHAQQLLAAALQLLDAENPEYETANLEDERAIENAVHVELALGRFQGYSPRRIVEFLVTHTTLKTGQIGDIEMHSNSSFVEVPMSKVDEVYEALEIMRRGRHKKPVKHSNKPRHAKAR